MTWYGLGSGFTAFAVEEDTWQSLFISITQGLTSYNLDASRAKKLVAPPAKAKAKTEAPSPDAVPDVAASVLGITHVAARRRGFKPN